MKRTFLVIPLIALMGVFLACGDSDPSSERSSATDKDLLTGPGDPLPESDFAFSEELPYDYNSLEPHIDEATMRLHFHKHHKGYYRNFVNLWNDDVTGDRTIVEILEQISEHGTPIRNNAGGYYNHWLFWHSLSPDGGGDPRGVLAQAIINDFGSVEVFREVFNEAAGSVFGSGWAWLVVTPSGNLAVTSTPNQDNPLMDVTMTKGGIPILALDVWEHAYYLHYQNRRGSYIGAFWEVVDWEKTARRYEKALEGIAYTP